MRLRIIVHIEVPLRLLFVMALLYLLTSTFVQSKKALELAQKLDVKKTLIFSLEKMGSICLAKHEKQKVQSYFQQECDVAQAIDLKYAMQQIAAELTNV